MTFNTELNDLRIIICLRKSEVTVQRISACNVIMPPRIRRIAEGH